MLRRLFVVALMIGTLPMLAAAQGKKPATIKVQVPDKPTRTEITIEGKKIDEPATVKDSVRVFTTTDLEADKSYAYKIEVVIIPNNYTKIFRTREVTFKAGETVTVDMRVEDKKVDKIEVRWVPTPEDIVDKMCEMAKVTEKDVVHDYGAGDCVMLIRAVKQFKAKKGLGVELFQNIIDEKAKPLIKASGVEDKVEVRKGDILALTEKDCEEATVVLLYIGDDLGARLSPVLQKALKPGARVVSHRFTLGDWKPNKTIKVVGADGDDYTLHMWIVPEKKSDEPKKDAPKKDAPKKEEKKKDEPKKEESKKEEKK
ncbi:TIGR03000 domain-containing protein [Zavarzinella formosa]|uniref:TIGR03000 domain-containing protein n=1 Tax=Zavarzinella formosa TaxID=360055 RepID=UPI0002F2FF2B|nr:TIGR03000 domain-containing protein [Zavarzinella formosa]